MTANHLQQLFIDSAGRVGAEVRQMTDLQEAITYISEKAGGTTLVPATTLATRYDLHNLLNTAGVAVFADDFRRARLRWSFLRRRRGLHGFLNCFCFVQLLLNLFR